MSTRTHVHAIVCTLTRQYAQVLYTPCTIVHMYAAMLTHTHAHTCSPAHTCTRTMHTQVHKPMCTGHRHILTHECTCAHGEPTPVYTHVHTHAHVNTHLCPPARTHVCRHKIHSPQLFPGPWTRLARAGQATQWKSFSYRRGMPQRWKAMRVESTP